METISSKNNNLIKKIRSLSVKKYREQFGLFVLEGEKVVKEAINIRKNIDCLLVKESFQNDYISLIDEAPCECFLVADKVFDTLSSTVSPQPIMCVIKYNTSDIKQLNSSKFIVLDHLQDPGNFGTIIRSGIASGFENFVLIDSVDPFNDKTIRSASGTILFAKFFKTNTCDFCDYVKSKKIEIVVAEAHKNNIFRIDKFPKEFGLVIGNEGNGISKEILSLKHTSVSIPMDERVESLNAAISASILMFILNNK